MSTVRRKLALAAGCGFSLGLAAVVAALVLPRLVDADRYRALIEAKLEEALGRDVRLGEIRLSLRPPTLGLAVDDVAIGALPEEGGGDLVTARRLRLGVRLLPLFDKRLEVTSVVLEEPSMVLARDREGRWNVERLVVRPEATAEASADAPAGETPDDAPAGELSVASVRLTGGRLVVRDAAVAGAPLEVVLTDLEAEVDNLRPGAAADFELAAGFESSPGARLEVAGEGRPLIAEAPGAPRRLAVDLRLERAAGGLVRDLARAAGVALGGALGDRPLDLSARVEADLSEGGAIAVSGVRLAGADLDLRRDRAGRWNVGLAERPASQGAEKESAERSVTIRGVTVDGVRLRLRDEALADEPFVAVLDDLSLELDRLPTDEAASLRLAAGVEGGGGRGRLEVAGRLGPVREAGSTPVELTVRLAEFPVGIVRPLLAGAGPASGVADAELRVAGEVPARTAVAGTLKLTGAKVETGGRTVDLDVAARFDVAARRGAEALEFRTLELTLDGNTLALSGELEQVPAGRRWDVALEPTRLPAEDLAALLELVVPDFETSFSSDEPVVLEGRATGVPGPGELPDLEGRLEIAGFTVRHPSLTRPIERLDAEVAFAGETVRVEDLRATIGGSDLTGRLTATGLARPGSQRPRVSFALEAPRADLGEVLSTFGSSEAAAAATAETTPVEAASEDVLGGVVAEGDLRVARGSWDTLDFTDLAARVALEGGVMTLDPLEMKLYDGAFRGRVVADLNVSPTAFDIRGDAREVDVAPFLADNLAVEKMLVGRFTGEVTATGAGDDYDSIVKSLDGGGTARLDEGRLAGLDLLGTVSKVAGVLGQRTLARLADRIATESTRFERLEGRFTLAGGELSLTELVLESPDFALAGQGRVDLLSSILGGRFELAFSEEVSESMRREASRAGEVFWDPEKRRVVMPLDLKGRFTDLAATVDWGSAARGYAKRRAVDELTGLLAEALGGKREEEGEPPPEGPSSAPSPSGGDPPSGDPAEPREALQVEITRVRWGGSILLQDLKLAGVVRGARLERVALLAVDAGNRVVERLDRLGAVDAHLAGNPDPAAWAEVPWDARVDGKDLVLATFPLIVTVTAFSAAGERAEASTTVER